MRGVGGGVGQSHVADVGKQYPPLSWHQCSQRGYQAPGPHTDRDKRWARMQTFAFIHVHSRARMQAWNTQTNKRLTRGVCHLAAAPVSMVTAGTMR